MVNARQAALRDRRSTTKRKVLRPGSLSSASDSIARKMADAQFESMVKRYNDGVVSNEEMYSYLQSASSNPFFTDMDKVNINDKLRDFEVAVNGEHLEANFQSTEGAEKIQAAQALSSYYNERANNLESGTPAHSKALQDVANWKGKAETVYEGLKKEERKMARAQMEYQIALLPPGVESLQQQAEAYQKLALEAQSDGETIDALDWATKSQEIMNNKLPAEMKKEADNEVDDRLDILKSNYERGFITAAEAVKELNSIDEMAQEYGLLDMLTTIDTFTEKLGLDVQKGTTIEEFEERTFRIRTPSGGELSASIKDMKGMFQLEDDMLRSVINEIDQDPEVLSRYAAKVSVYSTYINGGQLTDGIEFYGLNNRRDAYSSWAEQAPEKAYTYENNARDTQNKITNNLEDLSEFVYALDAIAGENPDVQTLVQQVTGAFEQGQINTFDGGQQMGILVTTDNQGKQIQRTIPLNTQVQTTDEAGNSIITDTKLGTSIAKVPGTNNIYIKLNPISTENDIPGEAGRYSYAEYNGELFIMDTYGFNNELSKASELAETSPAINLWYNSIDQRTGITQKDYEAGRMKAYFDGLTPEQKQEIQLQDQAAQEVPVDGQLPTDVAQDVSPLQDLQHPSGPGPLGEISSGRGTRDPIDFSRFEDIRFDTPTLQPNFTPTYQPTTYTPPAIDFGSQLTSPSYTPSPLQSSGFTMDLPKDEWKPPTSNLLSGPTVKDVVGKVGSTIKSGVSSVGNWLKKIKMPWDK